MGKQFKSLLLAGGKSKPALKRITGQEYKALMSVNRPDGRPIIQNVIDALYNSKYISQIFLASPKEVQQEVESENVILIPSGTTLIDSLKKSISNFQNEYYILITSCDLPLITSRHLNSFITDCLSNPGFDIYYAIIDKDTYLHHFPQSEFRRIYAHLLEGSYTGGNIFLVNPRVIIDCADRIEEFILFRKHPLKMANILGRRIVVKYLKKYLSIKELEKMVPQYLQGYSGKAIIAAPEIALDIDKPVQLEALRRLRQVE